MIPSAPVCFPRPLKKGDKIAIIAPATEVKEFWVRGAVAELERHGYRPVVMPHTLGPGSGTFAATDSDRLADLTESLKDPEVSLILCARGGYGCIHLLSEELRILVKNNPKWLLGFSDISALHALWQSAGVASLHCSMAKQLTLYDLDWQNDEIRTPALTEKPSDEMLPNLRECVKAMFDILEERAEKIVYDAESHNGAIIGEAEGAIVGGNLAVLNGLAATPWDMLDPGFLKGKILFLEDIGEKIYQVERMLKRLQMAGAFDSVAGIIFGQFTDYKPDRNFDSMEEMIAARIREWGVRCPVALSFPIGHTSWNFPIPEGACAKLSVNPRSTELTLTIDTPK